MLINMRLFFFLISCIISIFILIPLFYLIFHVLVDPNSLKHLLSINIFTVLFNSIMLSLIVTVLSILISLPAAFLTTRTNLYMKKFWTVVFVLPLAIPSYIGSFTIISIFVSKDTLLYNFLELFGINLFSSIYGWTGTIIVLTLFSYPYLYLTIRASFLNLDPQLDEVAKTLKSNSVRRFYKITLPNILPSILSGSLIVMFYSLSDFGTPTLMKFNSFARVIYLQYQMAFNYGGAALLSLVLFLVILIILLFEYKIRRQVSLFKVGIGSKKKLNIIPLRKWMIPSIIFCLVLFSISFLFPLTIIFYWLTKGFISGIQFPSLVNIIINTLYPSALATIIILIISIPFSILVIRFPGILSNSLERITYISFAMPGIVVALSLVYFGVNYLLFLYQSIFILIFAYVILFFPLLLGNLRSSLISINPNIEEAAKSLGKSYIKIIRSILIPILKSSIISGSALVMIAAMKELPATLLLSPIGFKTLSTQVWSATEDALFSQAAFYSILLIALSSISVIVLLSFENKKMKY